MTAPTDHEAALAILRERFPESEGWEFNLLRVVPHADRFLGEVSNGEVAIYTEKDGADAAARALIASWDAATHAAQVRALVEAVRVLVNEAPANVLTSPENVCNYTEAQIGALRAGATALAALPASLREVVKTYDVLGPASGALAGVSFLRDHGPALIEMVEREGEALDAEREACAALIEAQAFARESGDDTMQGLLAGAPFRNLAAAIRARKEAT